MIKFFKEIQDKFTGLTEEDFDQQVGTAYEKKCCFGAKIAKTFLNENDHRKGEDFFYRQMEEVGWSENDIDRTIRFCGATCLPFDSVAWVKPVQEVLNRLCKLDRPITLQEYDKLFDEEGYDPEGYDEFGFDHQGYDRDGYDEWQNYKNGN